MPRSWEACQQIRDDRKMQILEVSARVFARKGLTGTKISDIAAELEMSQGLVYRYFSSKEELFTVVVEGTAAIMPEIARHAQQHPGTALDKMRWLTTEILPYLYERPEGALIIMHALVNEGVPAQAKESALNYTYKLIELIKPIIAEGQESGQFVQGEAEQLIILYLATLQGLSHAASFLHNYSGSLPDVDTILRCLQA